MEENGFISFPGFSGSDSDVIRRKRFGSTKLEVHQLLVNIKNVTADDSILLLDEMVLPDR